MLSIIVIATISLAIRARILNTTPPDALEKIPTTTTVLERKGVIEPCAQLSVSWAAQATGIITRDNRTQVPAQLAFDCLKSVPVDIEGDVKEIEELKQFIQFQSTLSYLKDGRYVNHERYAHNKPLDIVGDLDSIAQMVKNGSYLSDFDVQLSIHSLFRRGGDFHLRFRPDILEIFLFVRSESKLVSVSTDGTSLPQLYLLSDLEKAKTSNFTPSSVETINGKNSVDYLNGLTTHGVYHDADARYNSFFPNPAAATLDMDRGGQFFFTQGLYDGPWTSFGFANSSKKEVENIAIIREFFDFTNVTDGQTFFFKFCQGPPPNQNTKSTRTRHTDQGYPSAVSSPSTIPSPIGYPLPDIAQSGLSLQSYFLNGSRYDEIAVLAAPNLSPQGKSAAGLSSTVTGFLEAQRVLQTFFTECSTRKKTKLILDLRGNSGGTIDLAFELFIQLFPTISPFGATRHRAHPAFYSYLSALEAARVSHTLPLTQPSLFKTATRTPANYINLLNSSGHPFSSFNTFYGPHPFHNDFFTTPSRYNFSNHIGGHPLAPHAHLTGTSPDVTPPLQPFTPENILLLQDGLCGSACSLLTHLLRSQAHIQTLAVGGRPRYETMQGVGGTRGALRLSFESILRDMRTTMAIVSTLNGTITAQNHSAAEALLSTRQLYVRSGHFEGGVRIQGAVNGLDDVWDEGEEAPMEFIFAEADCRIFYTTKSVFDPVALWEGAVDVRWGDGACVRGSTGGKTATYTLGKVEANSSGTIASTATWLPAAL